MSWPIDRRAVFLDRDGVLNRTEVRDGKPYAPRRLEDFVLLDDAAVAMEALSGRGFVLVVVTNQPDVGNGLVSRAVVEQMHARLRRELPIDAIEACYHAQSAGCDCRKPRAGMLRAATARLKLDLQASYMVGDRWSDISAGRDAGCRTILIDRGYNEPMRDAPDHVVASLADAAALILASNGDGIAATRHEQRPTE